MNTKTKKQATIKPKKNTTVKQPAGTVESPFYTKAECAQILKCSVAYIDGLLRNNLVTYRVLNKMTRIDKESFDHYVENGFELRAKAKEAEEKYEERYQEFLQKSDDLTYHIGLAKSFSPIILQGVLSEIIRYAVSLQDNDKLTERNVEMISRLLFTTTVSDVEKEYGMTRENVRLIMYKVINALKEGGRKTIETKFENERLLERTKRQTEHIRLLEAENKKLRKKADEYHNPKDWRKRVLASSIQLDSLQLPVRALNVFRLNDIHTISDLMNYSIRDLNEFKGFGRKCVDETVNALRQRGIQLKQK